MYYTDHFMADVANSTWDQHLEDCLSLFESEAMAASSPQSPESGSDTESCVSSCGSPQSNFLDSNVTRQKHNTSLPPPLPPQATEFCYMNLDCGDLEYENNSIMNQKMAAKDLHNTPNSLMDMEYNTLSAQLQEFSHQILEYSDTKVFTPLERSEVSSQGMQRLDQGVGNPHLPPVQCVQPGMDMGFAPYSNNPRPASNMSESSFESFGSDTETLPSCNISHLPCLRQDFTRGGAMFMNEHLSDILAKLPPSYDEHVAMKVKTECDSNLGSCGANQHGGLSRQQDFWRPSEALKSEEGEELFQYSRQRQQQFIVYAFP